MKSRSGIWSSKWSTWRTLHIGPNFTNDSNPVAQSLAVYSQWGGTLGRPPSTFLASYSQQGIFTRKPDKLVVVMATTSPLTCGAWPTIRSSLRPATAPSGSPISPPTKSKARLFDPVGLSSETKLSNNPFGQLIGMNTPLPDTSAQTWHFTVFQTVTVKLVSWSSMRLSRIKKFALMSLSLQLNVV